ncbi:MAG TPA: DHA2 family efflux MFS transporter permease subunit [Pseudonocardia sp.]|nr:DHA2 family efflux MFS transporter permease subunit [Pseudonocardia sp.]
MKSVETENWLLPIAVVAVGLFMALLDVTVVNVAIPAIQFDFGGSLEDVLWIATAYTLTLGVVVPLSSWFGDRFGLTRLYIGAVLGFALTSGLCGLAWNLGVLIAARILQAIPGGILPVLCVSLLYRIVPKEKVGTAMGLMGVAFVAAPAVGPVVGGYLVEYVDWRLVFYINLPIGLLTVLAAWFLVPKVPRTDPGGFDAAGFVTIAIGLFALLLAASKGQDWGWTSYRILMLLVGGVLAMALFVVIELQVDEPLLDLRLFGIKTYSLGVVVMAILQVNLLASSIYIPVFLQQGQGLGAYDAGLVVAPQALAMCVASVTAGQLYERLGPRLITLVGCGMTLWGNILLCNITAETTHLHIIIWTALRGYGMSLAAIAALTAAVNCVEPKRTNQASALENVSQQIPGAFGIAVLASMLTSQQAQLIADRGALLGPDSMLARAAGPAIAHLKMADTDTPATFALFYRAASDLLEDIMARALSNMFLLLAVTSAVGVVLGLLLPLKQPQVENEPDVVPGDSARTPSGETVEGPREPAMAGHPG